MDLFSPAEADDSSLTGLDYPQKLLFQTIQDAGKKVVQILSMCQDEMASCPVQENTGTIIIKQEQEPDIKQEKGREGFPLISVMVKSEDGEDKSCVLLRRPKEGKREDTYCKGSKPGCYLEPHGYLHDSKNSSDTEDSEDWTADSDNQHFEPNGDPCNRGHIKTSNRSSPTQNTSLFNTFTPGQSLQSSNLLNNDLSVSDKSKTKQHECYACGKIFKLKTTFKRHLLIHTGRRPYSCSVCEKAFTDQSTLRKHRATHTDERPFSCSKCAGTFNIKDNLRRHMVVHSEERPFSCLICNKSFSRKSYLKSHMSYHTGERPYSCPLCNKSFAQKAHLRTHRRTHTGEKPFSCPGCEKGFTRKYALHSHMTTHAELASESLQHKQKSFTCPVCNKCIKHKSTLNSHMDTHTGKKPYTCSECNLRFSRKYNLYRHTVDVHGRGMFESCLVCKRRFTQKTTLSLHMKVHKGMKLFRCSLCRKRFTRKSSLTIHVKKHMKKMSGGQI